MPSCWHFAHRHVQNVSMAAAENPLTNFVRHTNTGSEHYVAYCTTIDTRARNADMFAVVTALAAGVLCTQTIRFKAVGGLSMPQLCLFHARVLRPRQPYRLVRERRDCDVCNPPPEPPEPPEPPAPAAIPPRPRPPRPWPAWAGPAAAAALVA